MDTLDNPHEPPPPIQPLPPNPSATGQLLPPTRNALCASHARRARTVFGPRPVAEPRRWGVEQKHQRLIPRHAPQCTPYGMNLHITGTIKKNTVNVASTNPSTALCASSP